MLIQMIVHTNYTIVINIHFIQVEIIENIGAKTPKAKKKNAKSEKKTTTNKHTNKTRTRAKVTEIICC